MSLSAHINEQARAVNRNPSEGQKRAGNYRKGHIRVHGLDIAIENPRGSYRRGVDPGGKPWKAQLPHHYGYIKRTTGADGDHVDVFVGPHLKSGRVYAIDQHALHDRSFDEHKIFIGFASKTQARKAYEAAFSDGKGAQRIGHIEDMSIDVFKAWLKAGDTRKPIKRADGGRIMLAPEDAYSTPLSYQDEARYQLWKTQNAPRDSGADYDLRGAFMAGEGPAANGHWTDTFKKPNHETFSDESRYATGPDRERAGHWTGPGHDVFVPPAPYADGGKVKWDDEVKWDDAAPGKGTKLDPVYVSDESDDHGLSERQKRSALGRALTPVTDYPSTYSRMNREAREQVSHGMGQLGNGAWETTKGLGNIGLGTLGYLGSPISAAYRTFLGQPVEDVTGIPREYTEFAGQLATPGLGFTRLPKAPVTPNAPELVPGLKIPRPGAPEQPPVMAPPRPASVERAQELGDEFGMRYSRGQAEGDLDRIRYEDMAARGAYGKPLQDRASKFFDEQYAAGQEAGRDIGRATAGPYGVDRSPSEAASAISSDMGDRIAQARTIVDRITGRAAAEAAQQRGVLEDQGRTLNNIVQGAGQPIGSAREMGEVVGQNVRDAARANRGEFQARYREFGQLPGEFRVDAVRGIGSRVQHDLTLRDNPIVIDDQLTPVASRAIRDLDEMSAPRIQNRADPRAAPNPDDISAVSLRGVDQMRKKLVAYYQAARTAARSGSPTGATDARAMQNVMEAFDAQIERAITEGLFSGDPRALQALQEARASYARYRNTFTPQAGHDDVGAAMRRIVERNATPEEMANMIIGSGKIGAAGTPVRLADRLEQVLGANSQAWNAIRQALWQRASRVSNSAGEVDAARSAQSILDFTGSTLARRMFSPEELAAMRAHAQGVRDLERSIANHYTTEQATQAQAMWQQAFGGEGIGGQPQAVFRRIVEGSATPEEISSVVFNAIGGGNPGNVARMVRAVERVTGSDSEAMAAIRQGVWQRITANAEGRSGMGVQRVVNNISELLHGKGSSVARAIYTEEQIAKMDRYAEALRRTIIPKYARTNSDTAPALLHAVRKYAASVASAIGIGTHGGISGGLEGYAVGKLIDKAAEKVIAHREGRKLQDSLDNIMPTDRKRRLPRLSGSIRPAPYAPVLGAPPTADATLRRLQGPVSGRAEDEKKKP